MSKEILVTGGTGLIGTYLKKYFQKQNMLDQKTIIYLKKIKFRQCLKKLNPIL